jgi:hypothetical protein
MPHDGLNDLPDYADARITAYTEVTLKLGHVRMAHNTPAISVCSPMAIR